MDKQEDLKCENCGNLQTYFRRKTNEQVCKICGKIKKLKEKKE